MFATYSVGFVAGCGVDKPPDLVEAESDIPDEIRFSLHVRPILSDRCYACHGPDIEGRVTDLHFDTAEGLHADLIESSRSRAVRGGDLGGSEVFHRITSVDPDYRMPPPESNLSLSAREKAIIVRWIEQGGEFEPHWAFTPPTEPPVPDVENTGWVRDPIDTFILAQIERLGLSPAEESSASSWLRRVSFDLTGLPPSIDDLDDFLGQIEASSPESAYESEVDRLLASDSYGERMAVAWLDIARYADSHGYQDDGWRNMWPWRDWVIRSYNSNQPYDEFVTDQLAGDLYDNPTRDQILATGFNRNHLQSQEGGIVLEEYRNDYVANRTDTFGKAFLALTVECARCHDHRYDPVSQEEYYELYSFFNDVNEIGNIPYAGEASPTVILTTEIEDLRLAELTAMISSLEREVDSENEIYDGEFDQWRMSHDGTIDPVGLVAHYPLDEFVEKEDLLTLEDLIQPDSAGYFWGDKDNLPPIVEGIHGNAMTLVGDGFLDMGGKRHHFDRTDAFSLSLWFRIDELDATGPLLSKTSGLFDGNRGYHLFLNEDHTLTASLVHVGPDNQISTRSVESVSEMQWHHIAMSYDGSSRVSGITLSLDGVVIDTKTEVDNLKQSITVTIDPFTGDSTNWAGDGDLRIGFSDNNQRTLEGVTVDELKVFNRAVSPPEIRDLAGLSSTGDGMRMYYVTTQSTYYGERFAELTALRVEENFILTHAPEVMVMRDLPEPRETFLLYRGQYDQARQKVGYGAPKAVLNYSDEAPRNRLGLAEWLFDDKNPLTARVVVNRLWMQIFGRGIVESADNFGSQGAVPSHPELLDYLAIEFRNSGWDTKAMLKRLVLSATYRQTSIVPLEKKQLDVDNLFLARGPDKRLTAEMMRDNALSVSNLLVNEIGGPPVRPYQPDGLWKEQATRNAVKYVQDSGDKLYRRSIYTIWKRTTPPPAMMSFDTSERNLCIVKRQSTSTPLQALILMNDPQFVESARILAERMVSEGGSSDDDKITFGFRMLTSRQPTPNEKALLSSLLEEERLTYERDISAAYAVLSTGEFPRDESLSAAEVAAFTTVASTIMNFDATIILR